MSEGDMAHYIYVIASRVDGALQSPCKVGITGDLTARLRALQSSTACPFRLELFASVGTPSKEIAAAIERSFHATQHGRRSRGEWYKSPPEQTLCILNLAFGVALSAHGVPSGDIDQFWAIALTCYGWECPSHWQLRAEMSAGTESIH